MKVISVRNPHASLIMAGTKKIETRSFSTKIRGRIGIHVSILPAKLTREHAQELNILWSGPPYPNGYIIGTVEVVDCVPAGDWIEANRMKAGHEDYLREWTLGDLSTNRYAWILSDPRPFHAPIAAKGRLGFWEHSALDQLV